MRTIALAEGEFDTLNELRIRVRSDWPLVFSVNHRNEIWPFKRWGLTPTEERVGIRGLSKIIDEIADEYLRTRIGGGRFFIDRSGAFYKLEFLRVTWSVNHFVAFDFLQP